MIYITTFIASFAFIFLRAFQQRNVAFDNYVWIVPTSLLMASTEFVVISNIAQQQGYYNIWLVATTGMGGGGGSLLAAIIHKKYIKKRS